MRKGERMKIIKVESCFMCSLSDSYSLKGWIYCQHPDFIDSYGVGLPTNIVIPKKSTDYHGIWDKCPLEDYEDNKNK